MPPVGGFVALCVTARGQQLEAQKTRLHGDFLKIEYSPPFHIIKGQLIINFNAYRISHGGIKICLQAHLQIIGKNTTSKPIDILEHFPTETQLSCGDLLRGQKRLKFSLSIPPCHSYPSQFMTSNGSISYRLVALIHRDEIWEIIAIKLIEFKGYYNIAGIESTPLLDTKLISVKTGDVASIFTVNNPVVVMGQGESINASLELQGLHDNQVNTTLTFFRNIKYGGNLHNETIFEQNRRSDVYQNNIILKWAVVVPMMPRISYSDELIPNYSVRYFIKYEAMVGQLDKDDEECMGITGFIEVEIGTAREHCEYNAFESGSNYSHGKTQTGLLSLMERHKSATSIASMLSLPPTYSQLPSRSGSMMSLETMPPLYDDL